MRSLFLTVLALVLLTAQAGRDGKCRGIVLSGGGDKGAYQASALTTLIKELPQIETEYDVISGISVGSLNGLLFSAFEPGQEDEFAEAIMEIWHNVNFKEVFDFWPGGILEGITDHSAIFDDQPLIDLIDEVSKDYVHSRYYIAGTADMNSGTFQYYEYAPSFEPLTTHMKMSAIASSSMPGVFEYVERDGMVLLDGGIVWRSDSYTAIDYCRNQGYDDEDIIIDWIMCAGKELSPKEHLEQLHTWGHGMRALGIQSYYKAMTDLEQESSFYPDVNFRYTIAPSENISGTGPIPLDFSREHLEFIIEVGKKDAENAIKMGAGAYRQAILDQYAFHQAGEQIQLNDLVEMELAQQ